MQLKSPKYFPKNSGPKIGHHSNLSRNQSYLDQVTLQSLIFQLGPVLSDDQFFGHFILTWKPYLQFALKAKNIKKLTLCFSYIKKNYLVSWYRGLLVLIQILTNARHINTISAFNISFNRFLSSVTTTTNTWHINTFSAFKTWFLRCSLVLFCFFCFAIWRILLIFGPWGSVYITRILEKD